MEKTVLTTVKSYLIREEGYDVQKRYASGELTDGKAEFTFALPSPGRYSWHICTDFSLAVTPLSACIGGEELKLPVVETYAADEGGRHVTAKAPWRE